MNIFFINSLFVLLLFGSCGGKRNEHNFFKKVFIEKPLVPHTIMWHQLDSNLSQYGGLYSNFRTVYFVNDSIVYMFDCVNSKKLNCTDTSIFDKINNVYNDTVVCKYEDSILFGVENVEMYKGRYQSKEDKIVCEMKKITNKISKDLVQDMFTDTLKVSKQNNRIIFLYKNQEYNEAVNFKKESYKRLLQYVEPNKNKAQRQL